MLAKVKLWNKIEFFYLTILIVESKRCLTQMALLSIPILYFSSHSHSQHHSAMYFAQLQKGNVEGRPNVYMNNNKQL